MTDRELELMLEIHRDDLKDLGDLAAGKRFFARLFQASGCLNTVHCKSADVYGRTAVHDFGMSVWRGLHAANPAASLEIFNELMTPQQESDDGETD